MQRLIWLLDDPDAVLESADHEDWPAPFIDACTEAGLISPCPNYARFIRCPGCDEPHDVEVRVVRFGKVQRLIAVCSNAGVLSIPSPTVARWRPSLSGLASMIADALGIASAPQMSAGGDAWITGHVVRKGTAVRVCIIRSKVQLKPIIQSGVQHAIVMLKPLAGAMALDQTTVIQAADLIDWNPRDGITVNVDLIRALLHMSPDGGSGLVPRDGYDGKSILVLSGTTHRCPKLKPQLERLLAILATKVVVPISEIVHEGEEAIWRRPWDANDKKLVGAIRTALNELKNKLSEATPPMKVHFKLQLQWERISRTSGR